MSEYGTCYNGEWIQVYDFDKCIRALQCRNERNENRIKYLEEENRKLKEEYNKDKEIQKMQKKLDEMQKNYWRGFPISKEEEKAIEKWKKEHDAKKHGWKTNEQRMKAEGVSGGRYSYHFIPSSLGVSGTIRCHCGAKFEFQEIG